MGDLTSTACYRELGAELRKIREAAGLTEAALSQELGWSTTKISRSERGYVRLSQVDVILYLAFCGIHGNHGAELQALCLEAEPKPGHWLRRHEPGLNDAMRSLIFHEATASASTSYEPALVPGLLQTEGYIRALATERWPDGVDLALRVRADRRRILHRPSPARFTFFVHEQALRLVVGGPAIMHEQLLALLLLDGLANVAIRVVPTEAGAQAVFGGGFRLFEYADHQPLIYLDCQFGGLFLEDREYVDIYRGILPTIANLALDARQSREVLATIASDYDRDGAHADAVEEEQL